jgi:predicted ArsR family transcriptional regulator
MQTTRKRIMDYLETNRTASAFELSRAFRMTGANLRHHLQVLAQEGKIEVVGQDAPDGRGRPTLRYIAAIQAQDHSLGDLAEALLEQTLGKRASKQRTLRLMQIARRLGGKPGQKGGTITQRLVATVERLNDLRYRSHWEAHTGGPRLILGQCPYAQIIDKYPELCQMDAHLLEGMLGENVTQAAKINRRLEGPGTCVFVVTPKSDNVD